MNKEEEKLMNWLIQYQCKFNHTTERVYKTTGEKFHFTYDIPRIGNHLRINIINAAIGLIQLGCINMFKTYNSTAWWINPIQNENTKDVTIYNKIKYDNMTNEKPNEMKETATNVTESVIDQQNVQPKPPKVQIKEYLLELKETIDLGILSDEFSKDEFYELVCLRLKELFLNLNEIKNLNKDIVSILCPIDSMLFSYLNSNIQYQQFIYYVYQIILNNNLYIQK